MSKNVATTALGMAFRSDWSQCTRNIRPASLQLTLLHATFSRRNACCWALHTETDGEWDRLARFNPAFMLIKLWVKLKDEKEGQCFPLHFYYCFYFFTQQSHVTQTDSVNRLYASCSGDVWLNSRSIFKAASFHQVHFNSFKPFNAASERNVTPDFYSIQFNI